MCTAQFAKSIENFYPNQIKNLVFIIVRQCVFCEIGTELLNIIKTNFRLSRTEDILL